MLHLHGRTLMSFAAIAMSCGFFVGCVRISGYKGDGAISKKRFFLNPMVTVDFEDFSLAQPYKAQYSLDGLPKHHDVYYVGLFPDLPDSERGRQPRMLEEGRVGFLVLRLVAKNGEVMLDSRSYLDDMYWEWRRKEPFGFVNKPFLPDEDSSIVFPETIEALGWPPAILEVAYQPQADAPDVTARIRLTAGGFS